jgi:hypothetical protein
MAKNLIDVGINLNDGTGDNLRTAGTKINTMFQEVYDVFGDGTNLSNIASNLHIVNDDAPQLGGNLDMNGYIITGNGAINILSTITTSTNLVAVGAVQASTAAITNNSTFGGSVTIGGTTVGTVGNFSTSVTTATLNATSELQVVGPASITGAITSGAAGSKMRFYWSDVSSFPSATTYEGGLAFAEDTNRMYFASDTAWLSLAPEASPALTGTPTAPTATKATNTTQIATTAHVKDVVSDYAPLASPTLTGTPTTTTQATGTRAATGASTQIANSTYVRAVASEIYTAVDFKAPLASPALTGTPTAPTAVDATNSTQIATTAFVRAREDIINAVVALKSPIASPTFTGVPAAPTPADGTNTTQLSTTAFVTKAINNYAGTVTTALATKAAVHSPTFTGTPAAPTPDSSVSDTRIATTAYVGARIDLKFEDDTYLNDKLSAYSKRLSPAFTGSPTVPTAPVNDNTTKIANTEWIQREFGYASVPKWGGSRKYVSTAVPSASDGVDGDIWFQIQS